MFKRNLLSIGFAAMLAGILYAGPIGPVAASPLASPGAKTGDKAVTQSEITDVTRVGQRRGGVRRSGNVRRAGNFRRTGSARRARALRRGSGIRRGGFRRHDGFRRHRSFRRHSGFRRHDGLRRHRSFRRHGRYRRDRRSRVIISLGVPFGYGYPYYGYGYPYYDYGYGYGSSYYPPVAYVAPRSYGRTAYANSCRALGVGTRAWSRCCSRKYRSFNPRTGMYLAYSGRYRACR